MTHRITHHSVAGAIFLLLVVALPAIAQQPPSEKPRHTSQRPENVKLKEAKEAYAKQVAKIEEWFADIGGEAPEEALKKLQNIKERKLEMARAKLQAAFDVAIQRALKRENFRRANRLLVEKESVKGRGVPTREIDLEQFRDEAFYLCVLGSYGRYAREARYPVVNLSVPNQDLWSETVQSRLQGRIDFYKMNYKGDAKLIVPEDGVYAMDIPGRGTGLQLNGVTVKRGDVELAKGVYRVQITTGTHGQPYLPDSFVRILQKGTDQELPLVNTGADIRKFLTSPIDDHAVVEVSGYCPEIVDTASHAVLRAEQEE